MSMTSVHSAELLARLNAGELSAVELAKSFLARIDATENKVNAFLHVANQIKQFDAIVGLNIDSRGEAVGKLAGLPVAVKDAICTSGLPTTCASKMLENFVPPYDAHIVERLKAEDAVIIGKLNMDEFAMGSSTENSAFKTTYNPWDLERVAGGSSGGSAAAVSAGSVPVSLGSDTGGSIRQPASFCGVVGMKPTYGRVSRFGLVAYASSLDQIGPFGRSVKDVASVLQAIAGHDPKDSTSIEQDVPDYSAHLGSSKGPWRLGVPKEYFGEGLDPEVKESVQKAIDWYADQGCEIQEVSMPNMNLAVATYYIIATAEASSNLARFDGVRYTHRSKDIENAIDLYFKSRAEGFGDEVKLRIILGTYVLSSGYYDAYYLRAQKVRTLIRQDFMNAYEQVDALLTPTSPFVSFKAGEKNEDPLAMYLSDIYTISANLAGIPGLSLPCGLNSEGLPIGLQILGKPFGEADILAIGNAYEEAHDHSNQHPQL